MTINMWLMLLAPSLEMNSNAQPERVQHRYEELPVSAYKTYIGTERIKPLLSVGSQQAFFLLSVAAV